MTTKAIFSTLLLLAFFSLNAQRTMPEKDAQRCLTFESVSFSSECGNLTIVCETATQLTDFEINGEDAHRFVDWNGKEAADRFSMKLSFKPGTVNIRYKMLNGESKNVQFKIVTKDDLKLTL